MDGIVNNKVTGKDECMYVRSEGLPWHGKGTPVEGAQTAKGAFTQAGQDWEAVKVELETKKVKGFSLGGIHIPGFRAVVRKDTKDIIGICKKGYRIFQNWESYEFFDAVVGDGAAKYHTAGCLGRGERIWILAKLPTDLLIAPGDVVEKYLLLINSFDRTLPLTMFYTPIRVVCKNTCNAALSSAKSDKYGIKIRHSKQMEGKIQEAKRALGLAITYYDDLDEYFKTFYSYEFKSESEVVSYFEKVVPDNEAAKNKSRTTNQREAFLSIYYDDLKNESETHKNSLWYAYNAVTKYADHHLAFRETETNSREDNRIHSVWFGRSRELKQNAFDVAKELIIT